MHGPAIVSSPFQVAAGAKIDFDWAGIEGDDDYHVFGYLVNSGCAQTEVLDATGAGTSAWATKETTIATAGTYRIVFVTGSFNQFGGQGAGASLLVDNIRVEGAKSTDAVAQQIARKLRYANSFFAAAATRTVDVTAQSTLAATGFGTITVNLELAPAVTTRRCRRRRCRRPPAPRRAARPQTSAISVWCRRACGIRVVGRSRRRRRCGSCWCVVSVVCRWMRRRWC